MRRYLLTTVVLVLLVTLGCQSTKQWLGMTPSPAPGPGAFLPADEPEGWERATPEHPVEIYSRENLYLYLDQKADLYNRYGFMTLEHGTYRPNLLANPAAVVDVYQMDHPVHAYGSFSVERNREDKMVDIGGGGHLGEKECVFWKGQHFVRVKLIAEIQNAEEVLEALARKTEKNIPGVTEIAELRVFPTENRVPAGDAYYTDDLLGYECLGRGFVVEYDFDGKKAAAILAIFPPGGKTAAAKAEPAYPGPTTTAYVKWRRELLGSGETPQVLPGPWDHGYRAAEPKLGQGVVARRGRYIVAVFGTPSEEASIGMAATIVSALR